MSGEWQSQLRVMTERLDSCFPVGLVARQNISHPGDGATLKAVNAFETSVSNALDLESIGFGKHCVGFGMHCVTPRHGDLEARRLG
jgi:hypothetical protein